MLENMRISIQGIWSHKMRSFLTMLGIIIGIASIIAIVSTIKGTSEQIKEDLIGAGNNTVSVSLNYGDSDYDPEYGMTDGTEPPLLSDQQKEDVMNLDHVENATFFYSRTYTSSVYYENTPAGRRSPPQQASGKTDHRRRSDRRKRPGSGRR